MLADRVQCNHNKYLAWSWSSWYECVTVELLGKGWESFGYRFDPYWTLLLHFSQSTSNRDQILKSQSHKFTKFSGQQLYDVAALTPEHLKHWPHLVIEEAKLSQNHVLTRDATAANVSEPVWFGDYHPRWSTRLIKCYTKLIVLLFHRNNILLHFVLWLIGLYKNKLIGWIDDQL